MAIKPSAWNLERAAETAGLTEAQIAHIQVRPLTMARVCDEAGELHAYADALLRRFEDNPELADNLGGARIRLVDSFVLDGLEPVVGPEACRAWQIPQDEFTKAVDNKAGLYRSGEELPPLFVELNGPGAVVHGHDERYAGLHELPDVSGWVWHGADVLEVLRGPRIDPGDALPGPTPPGSPAEQVRHPAIVWQWL